MYHFNSTGVYPNLKNYGGVMSLLYTTPRNTIEKIKKKIIFYAVNFSFIYLHIPKFLLTFATCRCRGGSTYHP